MINNTIKITITNIDDYLKNKNQRIIEYSFSNKRMLLSILGLILGLILIISTLINSYDFKSTTTVNGNTTIIYNNYYAHFGIGIGLLIASLLRLVDFLKGKKVIKLALDKRLAKLKKLNSNIEFVFDESYFSKKTKLSESKIQWEYFYTYKIDNNFLHLFSDKLQAPISEYEIPLDSLDEVKKEALIELLKKITSNHKKTLDNK
ncbi:YcxB family protein [Tenacibaculum sp. M341]|uniref:YcxB family protein n=1 Tax=Tenacibaculum sp. M341 TaxID=2530339 RepID=UPI0010531A61|nr:YcxB family protein [Tenacibaculum sp. M341]TCI91133.1 hypothetical protein EYW44_12410 [Tenacibaculum sp. M341]